MAAPQVPSVLPLVSGGGFSGTAFDETVTFTKISAFQNMPNTLNVKVKTMQTLQGRQVVYMVPGFNLASAAQVAGNVHVYQPAFSANLKSDAICDWNGRTPLYKYDTNLAYVGSAYINNDYNLVMYFSAGATFSGQAVDMFEVSGTEEVVPGSVRVSNPVEAPVN